MTIPPSRIGRIFSFKYLLVVPVIIVLLFLSIYPLILQMVLSFTNAHISNFMSPGFVGLDNFVYVLYNPGYFWGSMLNTIEYVVLAVGAEFLIGLSMALLVYRLRRGARIAISLFLLPMCIAPVFFGAFAKLAFHSILGIIPYYMGLLGLPTIDLSNPIHAKFVVAALDAYQWSPFMFLILLAGLQSVPREPIEAARVDGASTVQIFRQVTMPLMKGVISVALIIRCMDAFKAFDYMFIMWGGIAGGGGGPGGPVGATTTISVIIYKLAYAFDDFGRAAAMTTVVVFVIGLVVSRVLHYFTE